MQIDALNYAAGSSRWAEGAANAAVNPVNETEAAARQTDTSAKGITANKSETLKNTADKSKDQKSKSSGSSEDDNTMINFKLHKGTGEIMIQIVDNDTGKVIREIPPEKILDSIAAIWKNAGINVDKKI